jgi:hypothetical protein
VENERRDKRRQSLTTESYAKLWTTVGGGLESKNRKGEIAWER